jgi:hypothetical protein
MCCGIKHIFGFPYYPNQVMEPELEEQPEFDDEDSAGEEVRSYLSFFTPSAPAETVEARLDRFLAHIREERPGGIVEAVLVRDYEGEWDQIVVNEKRLLSRGFRVVNEVRNSNSDNLCRVYHLNMEYNYIPYDEYGPDDD